MIEQLMTDLPSIRVGIMCHGDYCDKYNYITTFRDLSRDADKIVAFVKWVRATGGGDAPEAYELALRQCAKQMSWREDHAKALVMIGDSIPHPPSFTPYAIDWEEEVADLAKKGVKIYSVQCGNDFIASSFYETMARATGGSYLCLKDIHLIRDMFMGVCYREAYEGELARNHELYQGAIENALLQIKKEDKDEDEHGEAENNKMNLDSNEADDGLPMSKADILKVHRAIHYGEETIELNGVSYPVSWDASACRFVRIHQQGVLFIQQNIERNTSYAQMAREGHKITWMCKEGKWRVIINDSIVETPRNPEADEGLEPEKEASSV